MTFLKLIDDIKKSLLNPLPGLSVQLSLLSKERYQEYEKRHISYDLNTVRQSSVMVMLYEKEGEVYFPLIQRPEYDGTHSGQIALPGGKKDPEDTDVIETALRETFEEIGIEREKIEVLGLLSPVFIPPSGFLVNVVIGYCKDKPTFVPSPYEVAALIEFPLRVLSEPYAIEERKVVSSINWQMKAPGYVYDGRFVWGATAMILTELRELVK